jgi:hypothetical protein
VVRIDGSVLDKATEEGEQKVEGEEGQVHENMDKRGTQPVKWEVDQEDGQRQVGRQDNYC